MATKVSFTTKDGKSDSVMFPSRKLAESYAKSVRNPRLEDCDVSLPPVNVSSCPVGTIDAQKAATTAYFRSVKAPKNGDVIVESRWQDAESRAEMKAEHFGAAMLSGQSMEDAYNDWDFIQGRD